jgi:anthranilate synthase component 1
MGRTLLRHPLSLWIEPGEAFATVCGDATDVFWLDSGPHALAGRSYLGRASRVVSSDATGSVLEFLREELARNRLPSSSSSEGFALGWVGWLGYETRFETMDAPRTRESRFPDAAFLYVDRAVEFDHATRAATLIAVGDDWEGDLRHWRDEVVDTLSTASRARSSPWMPSAVARGELAATANWRDTDDEYLTMIRAAQASIAAGDAYQLCLTTQVHVGVNPDPVETYLALRAASPSHHGALLSIGDLSLLSSSPEQFLSVTPSGVIETRPIKGTRPRGATPASDAELAAQLLASEKERAENLMIVDLMRNDLSGVSEIGSVEVTSLLAVESYAQVHQLVSTVRGQLAHGLDGMDAVTACFPAGSMTGAPKSSAVRILDSLEGNPRGIYSGAFGYFGLDGRIDLAMVIRSIVLSPDGATIGVGGGITAMSDPAEELAEVKLKAAALLKVLGVG